MAFSLKFLNPVHPVSVVPQPVSVSSTKHFLGDWPPMVFRCSDNTQIKSRQLQFGANIIQNSSQNGTADNGHFFWSILVRWREEASERPQIPQIINYS